MNKKYSLIYYVIIFVVVQLIWLAIVGLWIARYVANHMILKKIGERYSIHISYTGSVSILVIGLSLLVLALVGMSLLFRYLSIQFKRTRMYDNFIANVTHELKTPLSSIKLYLDTLYKRNLPREKINKFVNRMQDDTNRLNELINKILDVAKIDQKEKEYSCKIEKTEQVFKDIFKKLEKQYDRIHITTNVEQNESKCAVDRKAMLTVFKNLIDNSLKYSREEPEINIELLTNKNWLQIKYQDNGIGIPSSDEKQIFNKFYRSKRENFKNVRGSGLGLYIVREIIKYHKGRIKASSQDIMEGTVFTIEIPQYNALNFRQKKKLLQNNQAD